MEKRFVGVVCLVVCLFSLLCACDKDNYAEYSKKTDNHAAVKMKEEGIWVERASVASNNDDGDITFRLSANVYKDMTEEDMLSVLDYFELVYMADFDETDTSLIYRGMRDADFTAYAVFYKENSDDVLGKFKYVNGKSVEYTDDEKYEFLPPAKGKMRINE